MKLRTNSEFTDLALGEMMQIEGGKIFDPEVLRKMGYKIFKAFGDAFYKSVPLYQMFRKVL